jgi:hypothetical protein
MEDFHVKLLHPFHFDEAIVNPQEVAQHDEDYYDIAEVRDHRFKTDKKRRTDLEFLLLFKGDKVPTWQPWSVDISNNEKIHDYLNTHQLRKYIPIKYTYPKDHALYEKPEPRSKGSSNVRKKRRKFGKY